MLPDRDQISVAEPMLPDTASVHEAAVRAVQVEQEPAVARLHEQVLIAANVAALETDVAGRIPAEHHPRTHEPDLCDRAAAARNDEPCVLDAEPPRIAHVHGLGRKHLLAALPPW